MKTLYKKATRIRAHTWKDIGGIPGLLVDGVFFLFLLMAAAFMVLLGLGALLLDYLINPFISLLGLLRKNQEVETVKTEDVLYPL